MNYLQRGVEPMGKENLPKDDFTNIFTQSF